MSSINKLMNSNVKSQMIDKLTVYQIEHVSEQAILHGMHKPYACDFAENKVILAENSLASMKED